MTMVSSTRKSQDDLSQALRQAMEAHRQGKLDWAEFIYKAILKTQPRHFDALHFLALLRSSRGFNVEAHDILRRALTLNPWVAPAWSNLGLILRKLRRPEEALAICDRALGLAPDDPEAHNNRGNTLRELGRPLEALASYDKALAIRPANAEAHNNRGAALRDLGRLEEALASCDRALAIRPKNPAALTNRGVVLQELKRCDEALASYDSALAITSDHIEALNNRGLAFLSLNRPEDALASFDAALAIEPDHVEALYNRGWTKLLMGDFDAGWRDYEHRWNRADAPARKLVASYPRWNGESLRGKSIIVYEEQGLGDVIQFARLLKLLASMGATVTFLVCASMHRLLQTLVPKIALIDRPPAGASFDFQCALMSLPAALGSRFEPAASQTPYLTAEAPLVAKWRRRIGDHGFKIGVCWQGNPFSQNDVGRFIPLRGFGALAAIPGARLISLQKSHGLEQLDELPRELSIETLGETFDKGPDAFVDTAAAMSCLDLIVTADTAVAHLAGALGRPVWVALKYAPDWRWMLDRADSAWHPSMTLYRQEIRDDWDQVFMRIAADIEKLIATRQRVFENVALTS